MEEISLSKFKTMTGEEIKESGCFFLTKDGEVLAIVIIGAVQLMKDKILVAAQQINRMRGL